MKSILLSIKPKHCANILNGLKTKEIRKFFPKDYRGWVYIYCTKDKMPLYCDKNKFYADYCWINCPHKLNGKIIARFYCDNVEEMYIEYGVGWVCGDMRIDDIEKATCLSRNELWNYSKPNKRLRVINITKLEIFDEPKELSEFRQMMKMPKEVRFCSPALCDEYCYKELTKAPQSWCYIEVE